MGLSSTLIYTSELILCSTICVPSATRHNIHMYPYFLFAAIHHLNRPRHSLCNLVAVSRHSNGRSNWEVVGSIPTEVKRFFSLPHVVLCFPLLGLTPSGLFMGLSSTLIYTSELILCLPIGSLEEFNKYIYRKPVDREF